MVRSRATTAGLAADLVTLVLALAGIVGLVLVGIGAHSGLHPERSLPGRRRSRSPARAEHANPVGGTEGRQVAARKLGPMQLSPECARVLGSLVEKGLTTPQQYPLTLNALVAACNQASNREPVVSYDEATVDAALHELKDQKLVRFVLPSHGRSVIRYRHVLHDALGLDARQCAILAVLVLRGPQTTGELRIRTERMSRFDGLDEVEHELDLLASSEEPLARNVGRRPGQKDDRWASSLIAPADEVPVPQVDGAGAGAATSSSVAGTSLDEIHAELGALRSDVARLRHELDQLRDSLGG